MTGIELAQEIRRRNLDLPIVLTSGYSQVLSQHGSHGFELLQKPYSIDQLTRVLHQGRAVARLEARGGGMTSPPPSGTKACSSGVGVADKNGYACAALSNAHARNP